MRHLWAISTCRRVFLPMLVAVLSVGLASCADIFLAINPNGAEGQICTGLFVSGEEFDLCRRDADGALGAFDVFIEDLVVDADGHIVLAGSVVVGRSELTQSFNSGDDLYGMTKRGLGFGHEVRFFASATDSTGTGCAYAGGVHCTQSLAKLR